MAGDDLESDDEYLAPTTDFSRDVDDDDEDGKPLSSPKERRSEDRRSKEKSKKKKRKKKKRKRADSDSGGDVEGPGDDDEGEDVIARSQKKAKKPRGAGSPGRLLLETGRGISERDREVQAAFLWTCFSHSLRMGGDGDGVDGVEFRPDDFYSPLSSEGSDPSAKSFAKFLRGGALSSMKRLKKWKARGSPMVVVVCISARRAVALLKQLAPLNVRCAKLFAKHMDVEDQRSMLRENPYAIAVGTPNRLLKLFENEGGGGGSKDGGALSLERAELVVIDSHEDHKRFTVCTLGDTAPDLMRFLRHAAVPQMQKRGTMKLAFF